MQFFWVNTPSVDSGNVSDIPMEDRWHVKGVIASAANFEGLKTEGSGVTKSVEAR